MLETSSAVRSDRTWMVALAAAIWGTSALMREPLTGELGMASSTVVFAEHVVLVLCLLPWLPAALRAWWSASIQTRVAIVLIGAGASALATTLFTAAFATGFAQDGQPDVITPVALQKLQPLIAVLLAAVILAERIRPIFWLFVVPALGGAWLLAFAEPFDVSLRTAEASMLALGAAVLWASGTVLGRFVGAELSANHITALRFLFGLATMIVVVAVRGEPFTVPWGAVPYIVPLALLVGLLALSLYYRGLRNTPASRATFAELAFPLTAAAVGLALGRNLVWNQWLGFGILLVAVTALALHENRSRNPAVVVPDRVEDAIPAAR
ncbi:MAG TPA: DMT family transporter [Jiangellales bacterium]|nr:DMT family transporter [Jiangellales bacterium]